MNSLDTALPDTQDTVIMSEVRTWEQECLRASLKVRTVTVEQRLHWL